MKKLNYKIIAQIASGTACAVIFSIFFMLNFINYGGNYGCWSIIDKIYNDVGYLSCGNFGSQLGAIIGTFFGVILIRKIKTTKYKELTIYIVVTTIVVPLLIAVSLFGPKDFFAHEFETLSTIAMIIGLNILPAVIVTLLFNLKELKSPK